MQANPISKSRAVLAVYILLTFWWGLLFADYSRKEGDGIIVIDTLKMANRYLFKWKSG
jgi:hypothetical protein